jgi:hypothetical protein
MRGVSAVSRDSEYLKDADRGKWEGLTRKIASTEGELWPTTMQSTPTS